MQEQSFDPKDISDVVKGRKRAKEISLPWPEALPLLRAAGEPGPFPVDCLPSTLRNAIRKTHEVVQAPLGIVANSFLAASNLVAQAHADILVDGRRSPISCLFSSVAESGERKTETDKHALVSVKLHEAHLEQQARPQFGEFRDAQEAYEAERRKILADKKYKTQGERTTALNQIGEGPQKPISANILVSEPTTEALFQLLNDGPGYAGIFTSEGGRLLGGYAMRDENKLNFITTLSGLWDGDPIDRSRKGDGTSKMRGRRFSMHIMLQPYLAQTLFADELLQRQGFLARLLATAPASTIKKYSAVDLSASPEIKAFVNRMGSMLLEPLPIVAGTRNQLEPRALQLDSVAKRLYAAKHDDLQKEKALDGKLYRVREFAAKGHDHAARLASTLAVFQKSDCSLVDAETFIAGCELVDHYAYEQLRLTGAQAVEPALQRAELLLQFMRRVASERGYTFEHRYLIQYGPNELRTSRAVAASIEVLLQHGFVRPAPGDKKSWELRPDNV